MENEKNHRPDPILPKYSNSHRHDEENAEFVRRKYEEMGIKIIEDRDELSWHVEFPEGWSQNSDGGYWVNSYDESGKERFTCFWKQCFWEYDTFVRFRD